MTIAASFLHRPGTTTFHRIPDVERATPGSHEAGAEPWQNVRASKRSWKPCARAGRPSPPMRPAGAVEPAAAAAPEPEAAEAPVSAAPAAPADVPSPAAPGPAADTEGEAGRGTYRRGHAAGCQAGRSRRGQPAAAAADEPSEPAEAPKSVPRAGQAAGPADDDGGEAGRGAGGAQAAPAAAGGAKPAAAKPAAPAAKAAAARGPCRRWRRSPTPRTSPRPRARPPPAAPRKSRRQGRRGRPPPPRPSRQPAKPQTVPPRPGRDLAAARRGAAPPQPPRLLRRQFPRLVARRGLDHLHRRHGRPHDHDRPVHVPQRPGRAAQHDQDRPADELRARGRQRSIQGRVGVLGRPLDQVQRPGHHLRPPVGLHPPGLPAQLAGRRAEVQVPLPRQRVLYLGHQLRRPRPRPLERFKVALADDGQIMVDKSQKFQQELGQWSDPDSFIPA